MAISEPTRPAFQQDSAAPAGNRGLDLEDPGADHRGGAARPDVLAMSSFAQVSALAGRPSDPRICSKSTLSPFERPLRALLIALG
jgi:hypothetical protein